MLVAFPIIASAFVPHGQSLPFDAQSIGTASAGPGQVVVYGFFLEGAEFAVVDLALASSTVFTPPSTDFRDSQLLRLPSPWGDVVACNNVATNAVEVCLTGDSILEGERIWRTEDVNGDGYDDIFTESSLLYIHDGTAWEEHTLPPLYDRPDTAPIGDIDGDGKMELWTTEYTDSLYYEHYAMNLHIHRFDDGYVTEPTWSIAVEGIVYDALAVQLDDDPEREILLATAPRVLDTTRSLVGGDLMVADLSDPPTLEVLPHGIVAFDRWPEFGWPDPLHPIGDIDGDGREEAMIAATLGGHYDRPADVVYPIRIAGASNGWDLLDPIVGLHFWPAWGDPNARFATTADMNGDGRLDIVTVRENHEDSGNPLFHPMAVDVWYAPWLEADPEPQHTADTADTGTPTTGDTGTTPTPTEPSPPATDEAGCGCSLRGGLPALSNPLHRRRPLRGTP